MSGGKVSTAVHPNIYNITFSIHIIFNNKKNAYLTNICTFTLNNLSESTFKQSQTMFHDANNHLFYSKLIGKVDVRV